MKHFAVFTVLLASCASRGKQEHDARLEPPPAGPTAQHLWLARFVGEWDCTGTLDMGVGQTLETKSTDRFRAIGEYWVVGEGADDSLGFPFRSVLTLGFDPGTQRFVGTWVDSTSSHMWRYDGEVDGDTLTLTSEGPSPTDPMKRAKFREVIEFKSPDHRVNTGSVLAPDGKWTKFLTIEAHRRE